MERSPLEILHFIHMNFDGQFNIDPLHKWPLNLNNNTLHTLSLVRRIFLMNVMPRIYKHCYSNLGTIYAKGQLSE